MLIVCFLRIEFYKFQKERSCLNVVFQLPMVWSFRWSSAHGWKLCFLLRNLFRVALATTGALSGISWIYPPQAVLQPSPLGWLKNIFWIADSYRPSFATVDPIDTLICNISFFHLVINSLVGLGPCGFWNCSIHLCNALIPRCFFGLVFNPLLFEVQKDISSTPAGITWNDEYLNPGFMVRRFHHDFLNMCFKKNLRWWIS